MLSDNQIFAKRLKQARILKKISMDQLVLLIGGIVTKQAISKYESGAMTPNSTVVIALSQALDVDPDYFVRPFSFDIDDFQVSFRKKSDTSAKDVSALKVKIQDDVERYLEVEEILGKKEVTSFSSKGDIISTPEQMRLLASDIRRDWELGNDPIASVQDILESKGIKVISTEAPDSFDGVSGVVNNKHYIVVLNKLQQHVERRRFTALHELGHLLYNERFSTELTDRKKESLCNSFASEMLLPSVVLQRQFMSGDRISSSELRQLQLMYGISIDAIMHKLEEIGIISESRYKTFCIRKRHNLSLKSFVEESRYKENFSNIFESMVYAAVAKGLISVSKASSLLHYSVSTVRKHLNLL